MVTYTVCLHMHGDTEVSNCQTYGCNVVCWSMSGLMLLRWQAS